MHYSPDAGFVFSADNYQQGIGVLNPLAELKAWAFGVPGLGSKDVTGRPHRRRKVTVSVVVIMKIPDALRSNSEPQP